MNHNMDNIISPLVGEQELHHREAVLDLLEAVFGEVSGRCRRETYDWQFKENGIGAPSRMLIYWSEGRPAGTSGLFDTTLYVKGRPVPAAFFTDLAVSPACRGRGAGDRLTAAVQSAGQVVTIGLGTNPASNHIMRKRGFVEVDGVVPMFRLLRAERLLRRRLGESPPLSLVQACLHLGARADTIRWKLFRPIRRALSPGIRTVASAFSRSGSQGRESAGVARPFRSGYRAPVQVRSVQAFPPDVDRLMRAVPHFWNITFAPDHEALNRRYQAHPLHHYRLEVAWRGEEPAGVAAWRAFSESGDLVMGHLSMIYFIPGDEEVADALVLSGLDWLFQQGAYLVKALGCDPALVRALRRHLFIPRGDSPGLLFYTAEPELQQELRTPWLVHLGCSDLDVR